MKGKKIFTKAEVEQIRKLIAEKLRATPDKQKGIRQKIRNIGFYYSDFDSSKVGYTVADFDRLIQSGAIKVIGDNLRPATIPTATKSSNKPEPKPTVLSASSKKSFAPLVNDNTEILILGTMPGDRSLAAGEYYAHSGNRFWKIIAAITNDIVPTTYDEKKSLLMKHKIGLWDVAKAADRKGSLDSDMSNEIPNDLEMFLKNFPKIRVIGFNGSKAVSLFEKFFSKQPSIAYHNLASTSGANTRLTFEQSCMDWKRILK